ncbi:hypothetical protein LCGC14_1264330 [marine sediment metagenome]|uniref:Uncharacterized protein n=1 Tax=marine sediment metagenome TaxID=412755 RepID=A0A0F9KZX3_9ZZZZ
MRKILDQIKLEWGLGEEKRKFLGLFLWPLAFFLIIGVAFSAEPFTVIPTTVDISVGASSTVDVIIPGGRADFFAIKNDCSSTLYFSIYRSSTTTESDYFLRLDTNESFTADMIVFGIGASAAVGNTASCAFTLILGRY